MEHDPAPALGRGLRLLQQLGQSGATSLERLSADCDIPKSSCTRLLRSLELAGVVHRDPISKRYLALQRLLPVQLGSTAFQQRLRHDMLALVDAWNCTVEFWQPRDESIVLIERCEPEFAEVRILARIGFPRSLDELEAVTQVWLAAGGAEPQRHWRWNAQAQHEQLSKTQVRRQIAQVREQGWAADTHPNSNRVRRLAVPLQRGADCIGILAIAVLQWPADPAHLAADLQAASHRLAAIIQEG